MTCTSYEPVTKPAKQKQFECSTCMVEKICQTCKRFCHKDHEVKFLEISSFICDCNSGENPCLSRIQTCSSIENYRRKTYQRMYKCTTCDIQELCRICMRTCHDGHNISFVAKSPFLCFCSKNKIPCIFYCEKHPNLQRECAACNYKGNDLCIRTKIQDDTKHDCYSCKT